MEGDPSIKLFGIEVSKDDEVSWISGAVPLFLVEDKLYLVSNTYSLGTEVLEYSTRSFAGIDKLEVAGYQLIARFPSGIWLPIKRFSSLGSLVLYEVPNANLIFEGFDYSIPVRVTDFSTVLHTDPVLVVGPSIGSGQTQMTTTVSSVPSTDGNGGIYNFSSSIKILLGSLSVHYMGSPVFLEKNGAYFLLGVLSVFGPESDVFSYVNLIPSNNSILDQFTDWHEANASGLTDYIMLL